MKIKTAELTGAALRWAVAKATGTLAFDKQITGDTKLDGWWLWGPDNYWIQLETFFPDEKWAHGGPIIEREKIELEYIGYDNLPYWGALKFSPSKYERRAAIGPTPLIAAMRCYVASKLDGEVEIPDGLLR